MPYYMMVNGKRVGPVEKGDMLAEGLEYDTMVWYPGARGWTRADEISDLHDVLDSVPPPPPPHTTHSGWVLSNSGPRWYTPWTFRSLYGWYMGTLIIGFAFMVTMIVFLILWENIRVPDPRFGWARRNDAWEAMAIICFLLALPSFIASQALFFVLHFKIWNLIQDGRTPISPGAAVGLLFVPFFNIYWLFMSVYGLAHELNAYMHRHRVSGRPSSPGLALVTCILLLVPFVNAVGFIMLMITMGQYKNSAVDIATAHMEHGE